MVSEIEIRLRADIARLQQDMDKARGAVGGALGKINTAVAKTMGAFAGLAVAAGAALFVSFIKGSIDAADALNDLSSRTKIATTDLAGLSFAAKMSGSELDATANAINKLSVNIGNDVEKFRDLGVSAKDPVEAFKQLADVFKAIQDPQQRAALGAATLGKSWAEVAPLMDEGSGGIGRLIARGKELSGVSDSMVQDAASFNDKLDEMKFAAQGVGTRIAADLLPMLNLLVDNIAEAKKGAEDATGGFSILKEILRALVLFGGNVAFTFKAIGTDIGAMAAQIAKVISALANFLSLDFKGGIANLREAFGPGGIGDMASADAEKARAAFDKWEQSWVDVGTAAKTTSAEIEKVSAEQAAKDAERVKKAGEFLKAGEIAAARKKAADEAAKAAEKEENAYRTLIATLKEKQSADALELSSGVALNEAQKARIKLDEELASGKLKLTPAHLAEAKAILDSLDAQEKSLLTAKHMKEAIEALDKSREAAVNTAVSEAEAQEKLVAEFGKSKSAIIAMSLARDEDRLSQRASLELDDKEVAMLEEVIAAKKRAANAATTLEGLEDQKKAAEDSTKAQLDMWNSIDKTAHDTFVSIADGGKNTAQRLKESFKNTFFDWLYQMTVKKWLINIGVAAGAGGGLLSAAQASGGGGGSGLGDAASLLSAGKTIYSGFAGSFMSSIGGMAETFGSAIGSSTISAFGTGLATPGAVVGPTVAGGALGGEAGAAGAGLAGSAVSWIPIVGWIVAGMMANDKFFKQGWDMAGQKNDIEKSLLKQGALGNPFGAIGAAMSPGIGAADTLLRKLGLSDRMASLFSGSAVWARAFGHQKPTVESSGFQGNVSATGFQGQAFANILEKGGWFRSDRRSVQTATLGTDQQSQFDTTIKGIVESVKGFASILGVETAAIDGYNKEIKLTLGTDEAANQKAIADLFGGIADEMSTMLVPSLTALAVEGETTSATLQRVATNYAGLDAILQALGDTFGAVGVDSLAARERFLALNGGLEKLASNAQIFADNFLSEAERLAPVQKQVADQMAALGLAGVTTREQFKTTVMAIDLTTEAGAKQYAAMLGLAGVFAQVTTAAEDAAKAAQEAAAAQAEAARQAAQQAVQEALGGLERAVSARKSKLQSAYEATAAGFDDFISGAKASADKMRELAMRLRATAAGMGAAAQTPEQAAVSSRMAREQLATAAKKGKLPDEATLSSLIASAQRTQQGDFATFTEFQRAQLGAASDVGALGAVADRNATGIDMMVAMMQAQKLAAEAAYLKEQERLDKTLEYAQQQVEATRGTTTAVMDIGTALRAFSDAVAAAAIASASTSTSTSTTPAYASGGPEVTGPTQYYSSKQTGTMAGDGSNAVVDELRTMNSRMVKMEQSMERTALSTGRTAMSSDKMQRQFNDVSAGGSVLLTEQG